MRILVAFLILLFANELLFAKGVRAGTIIKSTATLSFSFANSKEKRFTNSVSEMIVAQVVDLLVSWSDLDMVSVSEFEREKFLTFRIQNIGNGKDRISLLSSYLKYKSDFLPKGSEIFIDSNDNLKFDSKDEKINQITLDADEEKMIFVVCDLKRQKKLKSGDKSYISLKALSLTGGSGIKGKVHKGKGINGVDVVDGLSGGVGEDEGIFVYRDTDLQLKKEVSLNQNSGLITVLLKLTFDVDESFSDVVIEDFIPKETIFVDGSLIFDNRSINSFSGQNSIYCKRDRYKSGSKISLKIGKLDSSKEHTISYKLKIKKG